MWIWVGTGVGVGMGLVDWGRVGISLGGGRGRDIVRFVFAFLSVLSLFPLSSLLAIHITCSVGKYPDRCSSTSPHRYLSQQSSSALSHCPLIWPSVSLAVNLDYTVI